VRVFDVLELLVVEAGHLGFDPVADIGAREMPVPTDLLARQLSAAGQLAEFALIPAQQAGQLS